MAKGRIIVSVPNYISQCGIAPSTITIETRKIGNTWEAREADTDSAWHHGRTRKGVVASVCKSLGLPDWCL